MAKAKTDPADDITPADSAAELAALKAQLAAKDAELERVKAGPPPQTFAPGKRYKVSLHDGPTAVVEPEPGEHPWDAFRRKCGVISSIHQPTICETEEPVTEFGPPK